MQNTGFLNETDLYTHINNKFLNQLNDNLKNNLILRLSNNIDSHSKIYCFKIGGGSKSDLRIVFNNQSYFISVKKGTGNSLHQEPIDTFTNYIQTLEGPSVELTDSIKYFIWGDNTLDGTGNMSNRMSASQIKKNYPVIINRIQSFFNLNKKTLIRRFIKDGVNPDKPQADYIYYGTVTNGTIRPINNIIDYLCNITKPALSVGGLTFQAWNRNINGGDKSENKRGVVQLKWGNIGKDLLNVT